MATVANSMWGSLLRLAAVLAVGLTLANALQLSFDLWKNWISLALMAATAVAVTVFHLSLVLTLAIFGGISMYLYHRSHPFESAKPS